jgi:protein SCO1
MVLDLFFLLESKYDINITPLFVTIDPQRDSPAQLKAYLTGKVFCYWVQKSRF